MLTDYRFIYIDIIVSKESDKDKNDDDDVVNIAEMDNVHHEFIECVEGRTTSSHRRSWILRSGTDVGAVMNAYVKTIPDTQKCLK